MLQAEFLDLYGYFYHLGQCVFDISVRANKVLKVKHWRKELKKTTLTTLVSSLVLLTSAQVVYAKVAPPVEPNPAVYISERDSSFGSKTLTYDSQTNLEWLDIRLTQGISYSDVLSQLSTTFKGYRIASYDEVNTLFLDAGVYKGASNFTSSTSLGNLNRNTGLLTSYWADNLNLDDYYKLSISNHNQDYQFGAIYNQSESAQTHKVVDIYTYNVSGAESGARVTFGSQSDNATNLLYGVALLRNAPVTPVPEAESLSLLLAGLGMIGFRARRKSGGA